MRRVTVSVLALDLPFQFRIPHSALRTQRECPRTPQRRPPSLSAAPCEGLTRFTSGRPADLGRRKLACRLPVLYGRRTTPPRYGRGHPDCSNRRSTESTPAYSVWSRAAWAASRTPALRRAVLYVIQWFSTAARPRANPTQGTWPRRTGWPARRRPARPESASQRPRRALRAALVATARVATARVATLFVVTERNPAARQRSRAA